MFDYFGSIIVMLGSADFFTANVVNSPRERWQSDVPSIGLAIDGRFSVEKEPMICANGLKNVSRENVNLGEKHFGKSLCNQLSKNCTKLRQKKMWANI